MSAFAGQSGAAGVRRVRAGGTAPAAAKPSPGRRARARSALLAAPIVCAALALGAYQALPASHSAPSRAHAAALRQAGLLSLPVAAQGAVSGTLGAQNRSYRLHAASGGFASANDGQRLQSTFTASGVSVLAGHAELGLRLVGAGYGPSLRTILPSTPHADGNRVAYAHTGLSEWYVNGPLGLEQGFTLKRPPATHNHGVLTLAVGLSGNVGASLAHDGRSVELTRDGRRVLRYTGLSASDASGHTLHSWLSLNGRRILLHLDARWRTFPAAG